MWSARTSTMPPARRTGIDQAVVGMARAAAAAEKQTFRCVRQTISAEARIVTVATEVAGFVVVAAAPTSGGVAAAAAA